MEAAPKVSDARFAATDLIQPQAAVLAITLSHEWNRPGPVCPEAVAATRSRSGDAASCSIK